MTSTIILGLMIPFIGTALGSACVFFLRDEIKPGIQRALLGFASGVMIAAAVWSLLIPAMEMSEDMGKLAFIPAAVGFAFGMAFLLLMDRIVPHMHADGQAEGIKSSLGKSTMLVLAVTLHNIPEGMAVGVVFAGALDGANTISTAGAFALALGIAIQNFPEGAVISMPLKGEGISSRRAFFYGAASGIVEPIGAVITIALAAVIVPVLPYLLAFAAGAMAYVVVEELIPEASSGEHSNIGAISFSVGFILMMILDVALG